MDCNNNDTITAYPTNVPRIPDIRRLLSGSPRAEVADPAGLARAISAGFIGRELYDGVDPDGAAGALDALDQLGALIAVVDDLGPIARRAMRAKMRRKAT